MMFMLYACEKWDALALNLKQLMTFTNILDPNDVQQPDLEYKLFDTQIIYWPKSFMDFLLMFKKCII